ncbi:MAG: hypothetical protein WCD38_11345 [Candidatus Tumulicola sp.]
MRSTQLALRVCLVAVAAALAAAAAHVLTDVAGDYLLSHDAYDGVAHHSRPVLLALAGLVLLVAALRIICDLLDRRCSSKTSMLAAVRAALGHPAVFAVASGAAAIAALAGMEFFDCSLAGRIAGIDDLFGGSVALGGGTALFLGAACGWIIHRCVRLVAKYEAPIAALIGSVLKLATGIPVAVTSQCRAATVPCIAYALILTRQGRKRGPPRPVFG